MLNVLQVVVWCGTVGAGDCGGYPLWGDSDGGPLLATHERNENALSSALRPRNVSVLTVLGNSHTILGCILSVFLHLLFVHTATQILKVGVLWQLTPTCCYSLITI